MTQATIKDECLGIRLIHSRFDQNGHAVLSPDFPFTKERPSRADLKEQDHSTCLRDPDGFSRHGLASAGLHWTTIAIRTDTVSVSFGPALFYS